MIITSFRPLGKKIVLEPIQSENFFRIQLTRDYFNYQRACRVIAVGEKISNPLIECGSIVFCDLVPIQRKENNISENQFWTYEERIFACQLPGGLTPIGDRILIEREMGEKSTESGIVTHLAIHKESTQSLTGFVKKVGLVELECKVQECTEDLLYGDRILLGGWDERMLEINLDKKYHFIVPLETIIGKYE